MVRPYAADDPHCLRPKRAEPVVDVGCWKAQREVIDDETSNGRSLVHVDKLSDAMII